MTGSAMAANLPVTVLLGVAGLGFGWAYFAVLRWTIDAYLAGRSPLVPLTLTLTRIGAAILFLGVAAQRGALPLIAAFLGFLVARGLALRTSARRTA